MIIYLFLLTPLVLTYFEHHHDLPEYHLKNKIEERKAIKIQLRREIHAEYLQFDINDDHKVDKAEMEEAIHMIPEEIVEEFFTKYDMDKSGIVTFHEYVRVHFKENLGEMAEEEDDIDFDHEDAKKWAELDQKKAEYERIIFPNIWDEIDPDEPDQVVAQPQNDDQDDFKWKEQHDEF